MISCEEIVKIYKRAGLEVFALQGLDLSVQTGELMAIIGNSGSGKSTLLNILGGLDRPSAGRLFVDGKDLMKFTQKEMVKYKRETVGFVWQNNARNLVPYLTALENIELPMMLNGKINKERALELLDLTGMKKRKNSRLNQLSGGEQQRIAIAIALANNPKILLADEPTGAVDTKTSAQILDVFRNLNVNLGLTIIIVTHDRKLSKEVDRVVAIRDGRTSSEFVRKKSLTEEMAEMEGNLDTNVQADTHVELAVVDKAGRLQIPKSYLESLGLFGNGKLKVELEDDKITLKMP